MFLSTSQLCWAVLKRLVHQPCGKEGSWSIEKRCDPQRHSLKTHGDPIASGDPHSSVVRGVCTGECQQAHTPDLLKCRTLSDGVQHRSLVDDTRAGKDLYPVFEQHR